MGLFSRNESASRSERRPASRSALSSEAQASDLRNRARRRLIGALVLVLAAVIVVPMLFDTTEPPEQAPTPVVVPSIEPPAADTGNLAAAPNTDAQGNAYSGSIQQPDAPQVPAPSTGLAPSQPDTTTPVEPAPPEAVPAPQPKPEAKPKPEPKPEPKPKAEAKPEAKPKAAEKIQRTDDGSAALAMLEGRVPPKRAAASEKGNFVLQIAAYGAEEDARVRRDRLAAAGVTNAYVERGTAGGRTTYRLRVGPFPSRDAAQAAQARLRALGYDNGFISSQ
ncbi:SPOR domain-containing protein [Pusillimonas sp. TS35]|uniref:SPOR domain-containing protein n=1 Tax=Paracandidimonas lactea TaxID=2895524 RepID=UPI00136FFCDB|nr:SPOR domain-containing protein [Paracandidimonas lactea]MYN12206.1 SPOR domain-containing protein [Pusillimonas sp. TS35]